jgi:serine/threonine protein phosphatase PrpC
LQPAEFEKRSGRGSFKNWKKSLKVKLRDGKSLPISDYLVCLSLIHFSFPMYAYLLYLVLTRRCDMAQSKYFPDEMDGTIPQQPEEIPDSDPLDSEEDDDDSDYPPPNGRVLRPRAEQLKDEDSDSDSDDDPSCTKKPRECNKPDGHNGSCNTCLVKGASSTQPAGERDAARSGRQGGRSREDRGQKDPAVDKAVPRSGDPRSRGARGGTVPPPAGKEHEPQSAGVGQRAVLRPRTKPQIYDSDSDDDPLSCTKKAGECNKPDGHKGSCNERLVKGRPPAGGRDAPRSGGQGGRSREDRGQKDPAVDKAVHRFSSGEEPKDPGQSSKPRSRALQGDTVPPSAGKEHEPQSAGVGQQAVPSLQESHDRFRSECQAREDVYVEKEEAAKERLKEHMEENDRLQSSLARELDRSKTAETRASEQETKHASAEQRWEKREKDMKLQLTAQLKEANGKAVEGAHERAIMESKHGSDQQRFEENEKKMKRMTAQLQEANGKAAEGAHELAVMDRERGSAQQRFEENEKNMKRMTAQLQDAKAKAAEDTCERDVLETRLIAVTGRLIAVTGRLDPTEKKESLVIRFAGGTKSKEELYPVINLANTPQVRIDAGVKIRADDRNSTFNQDRFLFDNQNDRRLCMKHRVNAGATREGEFAIVADGVGGSVNSGGQPGWVAQQFCEKIAEALVDREDQVGPPRPLLDVIASKARDLGRRVEESPARYCNREEGEIHGCDMAAACLVACQLVGGDQLQVYNGGDCYIAIIRPNLHTEDKILPGTNGHDLVIHRQRQLQCKIRDRTGPFEQLGMGYRIQTGSLLHEKFSGQNSVHVEDGDVILMCSDGLVDNLAFRDNRGKDIPDSVRTLHETQYGVNYDATLPLVNMVVQWWQEERSDGRPRNPLQLVNRLLRQPQYHGKECSSRLNSSQRGSCALKVNPEQTRDDVTVVVGIVEKASDTAKHWTPPRETPPRDTRPRDTPPRDTPPRDTPPRDTPPRDTSPHNTPPRNNSGSRHVPLTTRETREELARGKRPADHPGGKESKKSRSATQ